MTGCYQGCLITYISDISAREAWCLTSQQVYIEVFVSLYRTQMHLEYLLSLCKVWEVHMYLTIKTSCTQQCLIEHIDTVGCCHDDNTRVSAKAIHLCQQGIEGILTFVIAAIARILASSTTNSIDFINKDDTWCLCLCLSKCITNTRSANANEHLDKVRTRHREEWYASLSCHSLCQQCLTSSWRTYQESALWYLTTQFCIFLWLLEEVHNLLHLLLCSCLTGYILEGDAQGISLLYHLCLRASNREDTSDAAASATAEAIHEEEPDEDKQYPRGKTYKEVKDTISGWVFIHQLSFELTLGTLCLKEGLYLVNTTIEHLHIRGIACLVLALMEQVTDIFSTNIHTEFGFLFVDNDTLGIATIDVCLEVRI